MYITNSTKRLFLYIPDRDKQFTIYTHIKNINSKPVAHANICHMSMFSVHINT